MNRLEPLRQALPKIVAAANCSPPVEIVILNYSSTDDLENYLAEAQDELALNNKNFWTIVRHMGEKYYHSTRAVNITHKAAHGLYTVQLNAEALPKPTAIQYIRKRILEAQPVWMCEGRMGRWIICNRDAFIQAGGYDERFNAYGPEDKDFCERMHRRGGKFEQLPANLIDEIPTPNREKLRNLDTSTYTEPMWVKRQMSRRMRLIYEANCQAGQLIANEGNEWGIYNGMGG